MRSNFQLVPCSASEAPHGMVDMLNEAQVYSCTWSEGFTQIKAHVKLYPLFVQGEFHELWSLKVKAEGFVMFFQPLDLNNIAAASTDLFIFFDPSSKTLFFLTHLLFFVAFFHSHVPLVISSALLIL